MTANDLIIEILTNYSPNANVQIAIYNSESKDYETFSIDKIKGNDGNITIITI